MSFKKLSQEIKDALQREEITGLDGFAKTLFSTKKAGGHFLAIGPKTTGKTTAGIVSTFHTVYQELEGSPRVIFVCATIDEACQIHERLAKIAWPLDVTVDLAHDKGNIQQQRNDIFDGTEIIVGTPKRLYELYIQNGINFKMLELMIFDDLDEILQDGKQMQLKRMLESLDKCQVMALANAHTKKVKQFIDGIEQQFREVEWQE